MKLKLDTSLPIQFESIEEIPDQRFVRGKIWICHTGENRNRSSFSKEVLEASIPSLANIPVLGFIQVDNNNETDFVGHEQRIVIDKDGARIEYLGRMYGIVPESNNAKFETKLCDDGVEREFLTAEVVLHTKFKECIDIVQREGNHSHSMELFPDSIQGKINKNGLFEFTSFQFEGLCLLGEDVVPAMINSNLELFTQFSHTQQLESLLREFNNNYSKHQANTVKKIVTSQSVESWQCPHCQNEIGEKELFYKQDTKKWFHRPCLHIGEISFSDEDNSNEFFSNLIEKQGGEKVDEKLELFTKYSTLKETDIAELKVNIENYTLEELETKLNELFEAQKREEEESKATSSFSLTSQQLKDELRLKLSEFQHVDRWGDNCRQYWYIDHDDNRVYAEDGLNSYLPVGINYTKNGDMVAIDIESKKRIKWTPEDLVDGVEAVSTLMSVERFDFDFTKANDKFEEQKNIEKQKFNEIETQLNEKNNTYTSIKTEFDNLKAQYEDVNSKYLAKLENENEEKFNQLFTNFSKELTEEELNQIKSLRSTLDYEDIETRLFALVGKKKAKFSFETEKKPIIDLEIGQKEKKTSGKSYDELFEKYND